MQPTLFDTDDAPTGAYGQPVEPAPARGWATPAEDARLTGQRLAIHERLRRGPATNIELLGIAQRFGARIEELRKMGYDITTTRSDRDKGVTIYALR